jgi:hypothetical protein
LSGVDARFDCDSGIVGLWQGSVLEHRQDVGDLVVCRRGCHCGLVEILADRKGGREKGFVLNGLTVGWIEGRQDEKKERAKKEK